MSSRIMYIERKGSGPHTDQHPAYIGRVTLSKSGKTLHYRGKTFTRHHEGESNHIDEETGEKYWISGCRKDGRDRSCPGLVEVDEDVREEYWADIRKMPDSKGQKIIPGSRQERKAAASPVMRIVAIGGGEIKKRETLSIDRFIVGLTGKRRRKALFIPTASSDAPGYCDSFDHIYGKLLGCKTDHLLLYARPDDRRVAKDKILSADLIYVGGGNTLRMMKLWRQLGLDRLLKRAGRQGAVLSGLSAGANCWHEWGHSNSRAFSGKPDWSYIRVRGLGFADRMFCPHLREEKRHESLVDTLLKYPGLTATACDNNAAVYYDGETATCLTSRKRARACVYHAADGRVLARVYRSGEKLTPSP